MAEDNEYRLRDTDNNILKKILRTLQGGGPTGGVPTTGAGGSGADNVGGFTQLIKVVPTISASPDYTAGDAVGGKQTLTDSVRVSGGTAILESIIVLDRANQKAALEILIFDADPTSATITDNSAFVFSTDDLKVLARISVAASDYVTIDSKAVATLKGLGITLKAAAGTSLYAAVVTTGAPNYASTSDLQFIYGLLQD